MAQQRLDLRLDDVADINGEVRLLGAPDEDLLHLVRLQPFVQVLREVEPVARGRIDGIDGGEAGGAVVRVVDEAVAHDELRRVVGEDSVGLDHADVSHHIAQELAAGGQLAIDVAIKKEDVLHAQHVGGGLLLLAAHRDESVRRHRWVVRALRAVGADEVVELPPLLRPDMGRAGAAEVGVVRVGGDGEGDLGPVAGIGRALRHGGGGGIFRVGCQAAPRF